MQPQGVGELFNISTIQANHAIGAWRGGDEEITRRRSDLATACQFPAPREISHNAGGLHGNFLLFVKGLYFRSKDRVRTFDFLTAREEDQGKGHSQ